MKCGFFMDRGLMGSDSSVLSATSNAMHRMNLLSRVNASTVQWLRVGVPGLRRTLGFMVSLATFHLTCGLRAQAPAGSAPGTLPPAAAAAHVSALGVPFADVPGVPVSFAIWETRVSDFETFVRETGYAWNHRAHFPQTSEHPVVNVSLRDAIAFCNWLTKREQDSGRISALQSYRLPNKKEWDAAIGLAVGRKTELLAAEREMDKQVFAWGTAWPPPPRAANFNSDEISGTEDGFTYTAPVGQFASTGEGIYDLAGNVWEWTWDQEVRAESIGVLRGGSWMYFRKECLLSSYEYPVAAELRAPSIGFRCVFEDKRRVQAFLAAAQETSKGRLQELREKLGTPAVPEQEVAKMRQQLDEKPAPQRVGPTLPDIKSLKPARTGEPFVNSLGMNLLPLAARGTILMGVHEVRVQDYEAAMAALGKSWDRKPPFPYTEAHPVVNVSWDDAVAFCDWLTKRDREAGLVPDGARYRLPADAEWSRAVALSENEGGTPESLHLGNKLDYPWGTGTAPPMRSGNFDSARMSGYQDNFSHAAPVGSFSPNTLQLHDLAGNVAEWCQDVWPSAAGDRVVRGSSWLTSTTEAMLSSFRQHLPTSMTRPDLGFRVVLELPGS